ncbi:MarR family winged helix-turn-helix transcriptional regulator [Acetivibrio cellulolyticus]|uniref:MarR family winged helix-turn-helix transcriptional regulator n=1 Tax=Acetivibrio cellulolyticus TaxID=35830 RepID=UPI0001E2D076|nr:MarR family transcriptional regulator [Acetivibrio cellulolyticus]
MDNELLRSIYLKIKNISDISSKDFTNTLSGFTVTGVQFGVLRNISESGARMSELVQKVKCAASNMTSIIKRMERDKLVITSKNSNDMRETLVYLTQKGRDTLNEMEDLYKDFLMRSYGSLSLEEQHILNLLLIKLEENLTK